MILFNEYLGVFLDILFILFVVEGLVAMLLALASVFTLMLNPQLFFYSSKFIIVAVFDDTYAEYRSANWRDCHHLSSIAVYHVPESADNR